MIIEFSGKKINLVFCCVDNIWQYSSGWTRELIKNQSDYTINNITSKGYTVLQGLNADVLLSKASQEYNHAVVFSTGTEFINGNSFFKLIEKECNDNYLVKGHILDRRNAYYELHHQCYLVNLHNYKSLGCPSVGHTTLGEKHRKIKPIRSVENIHDDYTPTFVSQGTESITYDHKLHGYNIISKALQKYDIASFNKDVRNSKKHYYPENQKEFLKKIDWAYKRESFCRTEFVHTESTEWGHVDISEIEQIFTPASGNWWVSQITKNCKVVLYDYNKKSLDYWKNLNPSYSVLQVDLLNDTIDFDFFDPSKKTLINLSNIFAYEGTAFTYSLEKRLQKESEILENIKQNLPNALILFSIRSCTGFIECQSFELAKNIKTYSVNQLKIPTWHANGDWNG